MNKEYLCINDKLEYETKGSTPKYVENSSVIVLNQKCIRNGIVDYSFSQFISEQQNIAAEKYVKVGDVLLNSTGQGTAGRCAFVDYIPENYKVTVDSHMLILRFENIELARFFTYSLFNQESFILELLTGSSGQGELDREIVYNISFPYNGKNLEIFNKILIAINNKIKLNNKINKELEKLAKTLYEYWFVQFDFPDENNRPYKSSGGEMVYSNELKREIPLDWEIGNLYTIADYYNGLACQKFRPIDNEQSLPVVKIGEMHNGINVDTELVKANIPAKNIIDSGDILFSWSATLEVMLWTGNKAGLNQHIFKVVPKSFYSKEYVYQQLSSYVINFVRIAEARKTTMGHITTDHLKQSKITLPPKEIIEKYSHSTEFVYKKMIECKKENLYLIKLRDFLLPMLMNGQVIIQQ